MRWITRVGIIEQEHGSLEILHTLLWRMLLFSRFFSFYLAKKKKKTVGFSSFINETPNVPAIKRTKVENLVLFFSLPAVVPACFYRINRVNYDCHYTNCRIRRILFIYERMYMYSSNSSRYNYILSCVYISCFWTHEYDLALIPPAICRGILRAANFRIFHQISPVCVHAQSRCFRWETSVELVM